MLTSPSGKSYIGQTIRSIEERFKAHQKESSRCMAIYNAIKKYGWENFEKDYYECPYEDLNFDEELLIREMGTLAPKGYNLKEGGDNGRLSEEIKQKISEAHIGKTLSYETKRKMSEAHIGKTLSDETKRKIGEAQQGDKNHRYGKTPSGETKQKLRESQIGKTHSEETKQKMSEKHRGEKNHNYGKTASDETKQKMSEARKGEKNYNSKRVYQYDLEGNLVGSFGSTEEAGRHLKKSGSNIAMCARGERKTAHKFKWSYENSM